MVLRNRTTSMSHSTKSLTGTFFNRAEARTSCYRNFVIPPACGLLVPFYPRWRKTPSYHSKIPQWQSPILSGFPSKISRSPQAMHGVSLPPRVYFSNYGNPSINALRNYEGLHPISPATVGDLFSLIQQRYSKTTYMRIHYIHTSQTSLTQMHCTMHFMHHGITYH